MVKKDIEIKPLKQEDTKCVIINEGVYLGKGIKLPKADITSLQ